MDSTVCFFLHGFAGGGAERSAVTLANAITERGWRVQFIVQTIDGPFRKLLDPRTDVIVLGGRARWLPIKLGRYLRWHQPKAIISIMTGSNILALISEILSGWRGRLIVNEQNSLQETWRKFESRGGWVFWGLMRLLYRRADQIVAVSQQLACDLVKELNLPAEKVVAIPNPLPLEEIRQAAMAPVSHRFFSEAVPVLIAVGRLHPQKDFPTLIQAVADLRKRRDVRLIVLGEGPDRSKLEMLVQSLGLSDVVDLPGFVSPPWPWMARADVFVLSSRAEGWPCVLAEALALGVPVVATDCPTGPREMLAGEKFGRLVRIGDVLAISKAIEDILDNPLDRAILRDRAGEWSTERVVESYLSILPAQGKV